MKYIVMNNYNRVITILDDYKAAQAAARSVDGYIIVSKPSRH